MNTTPSPGRDTVAPASATADNQDSRAPRTPLTPARIGESIGEDADPEQDVAPNLGGESQMQDA